MNVSPPNDNPNCLTVTRGGPHFNMLLSIAVTTSGASAGHSADTSPKNQATAADPSGK